MKRHFSLIKIIQVKISDFIEENALAVVLHTLKNPHHHKFKFKKENNKKQPNKQTTKK